MVQKSHWKVIKRKKQVWMQDQRNTGGKYFFLKCEENICMSNLKLNMYACICVCIKLNNRKLKKKGGKKFSSRLHHHRHIHSQVYPTISDSISSCKQLVQSPLWIYVFQSHHLHVMPGLVELFKTAYKTPLKLVLNGYTEFFIIKQLALSLYEISLN